MVASTLARLRTMPVSVISRATSAGPKRATASGSKPANAERNASRLRRIVSQDSPDWNASRVSLSNSRDLVVRRHGPTRRRGRPGSPGRAGPAAARPARPRRARCRPRSGTLALSSDRTGGRTLSVPTRPGPSGARVGRARRRVRRVHRHGADRLRPGGRSGAGPSSGSASSRATARARRPGRRRRPATGTTRARPAAYGRRRAACTADARAASSRPQWTTRTSYGGSSRSTRISSRSAAGPRWSRPRSRCPRRRRLTVTRTLVTGSTRPAVPRP